MLASYGTLPIACFVLQLPFCLIGRLVIPGSPVLLICGPGMPGPGMEGDSAEYSVYNLRGGALVFVATMQADASHGAVECDQVAA